MRSRKKRRNLSILIFLGAGLAGALLYGAFLEFYYFRDKVDWLFPLSSENNFVVRSDRWGKGDFGARRSGRRRHQGVDILAHEGTRVIASRAGRARVGEVPTGMGKFVSITHRDGVRTIYGHLSEVLVKDRSRIRQGQVIGTVGRTGNASAKEMRSHLHFEMRKDKEILNPTEILTRIAPKAS
jgi:murein DD-endopeptidase MepM/ murein hydrolase activator NlpD